MFIYLLFVQILFSLKIVTAAVATKTRKGIEISTATKTENDTVKRRETKIKNIAAVPHTKIESKSL